MQIDLWFSEPDGCKFQSQWPQYPPIAFHMPWMDQCLQLPSQLVNRILFLIWEGWEEYRNAPENQVDLIPQRLNIRKSMGHWSVLSQYRHYFWPDNLVVCELCLFSQLFLQAQPILTNLWTSGPALISNVAQQNSTSSKCQRGGPRFVWKTQKFQHLTWGFYCWHFLRLMRLDSILYIRTSNPCTAENVFSARSGKMTRGYQGKVLKKTHGPPTFVCLSWPRWWVGRVHT